MGTGHWLDAEFAHVLAAAAHEDGEELVGIGLDPIWVVGHHQDADFAAGAALISIERDVKDTCPRNWRPPWGR